MMVSTIKIYEEALELMRKGVRCAIVTITDAEGSTPRGVGARMIVKEDGDIIGTIGGGSVEGEAVKLALQAIKNNEILKKDFDLGFDKASESGLICGGRQTILIEPVEPIEKLIICGGGHVGQALAQIASLVNFQITIIDDREEFINPALFPPGTKTILSAKWVDAFKNATVDSNTYIVIVTRHHAGDEICLRQVLKTNAKYLGMIGSKSKVQLILDKLIKEGYDKKKIKNLHSPIGLKIGGSSPQEIAVSIAAELIQTRYQKIESADLKKH